MITLAALAIPALIIGSVADLMILFAAGWGVVIEYRKIVSRMQQVKIRKQSTRKPDAREIDTRTPSGRRLPY